jgi:hypothetical protein
MIWLYGGMCNFYYTSANLLIESYIWIQSFALQDEEIITCSPIESFSWRLGVTSFFFLSFVVLFFSAKIYCCTDS